MNRVIEYVSGKNIIMSRFSGEVFLRSIIESAEEGIALSQKTGCHNYVIDITETIINITFPEVIVFLERLLQMGFTSKDKVAFVINREERDHTFWETAAVNRDWGRIGFFTSPEEAEKWILMNS
jgi:hypothetical protein